LVFGRSACRRDAGSPRSRLHPHELVEMAMARASAIACGHKDAIDLDWLWQDPPMKVPVGRRPDRRAPPASQSIFS
jgi:hypothetical protein